MSELTIYHNPGCSKSRETLTAIVRGDAAAIGRPPQDVEPLLKSS